MKRRARLLQAGWKSIALGGASAFVLLTSASPAWAYGAATQVTSESIAPPATKLETTNGTSPGAARTFYGAGTTHTTGLSIGATIPEEIATLAESIRAGRDVAQAANRDAFAADVLAYVRNAIRTEVRYGLSKGALGALIDQSGSPFDQAELMVMLLESEGVDASFVSGDVVMTAAQFGKWAGLVKDLNDTSQTFTVHAAAACKLLADGGVPVSINGSSDCGSLSGDLSNVTLSHIWVRVAGINYDPSFKEHVLRNGIDLPAAMGCGTAGASTCGTSVQTGGMTGASQGTLPSTSIPYLEGYSASGAAAALDAKTLSLVNTIKTGNIAGQGINASVYDVLGGRKLEAQTLSGTPLQYTEFAVWSGRIPDKYRSILTVHAASSCASFFADEIAARQLLVKRPSNSFFVGGVATSTLSYVAAKSCSGTAPHVRIAVDHPYAGSSGAYADRAVDFKPVDPPSDETGWTRTMRPYFLYVEGGPGAEPAQYIPGVGGTEPQQLATDWPEQNYLNKGSVTIVHEFGQSGASGQKYMSDRDAVAPQASEQCTVNTTTSLDSRQCDYDQHAVVAKAFNTMRTMTDELVDGVNKTVSLRHHDVGIVYNGRGSGVAWMSIQESISITPVTNSATVRNSAFDQASLILAEAESRANAIESAPGISAARAFFSRGVSGRIVDIAPANMAAYAAYLPKQAEQVVSGQTRLGNYCIKYFAWGGNSLGPDGCFRHTALQDVANQGYSTLIAEGGLGELFYKGSDERAFTMWEYVKGGATVGDGYSSVMKTTEIVDAGALRQKYLSVSPSSGDLSFSAGADIVTGAGEFPQSLPFVRTFSQQPYQSTLYTANKYYTQSQGGLLTKESTSANSSGTDALYHDRLGGGWVHNYQVRLQRSNDLTYQLGSQNAYLASELIATLQVIKDLGLAGTLPQKVTALFALNNLSRTSPGYLPGSWNTMILRKGDSSTSFYEAPDGTWFAPTEIGAKINATWTVYTSSTGETISFSPYRIDAAAISVVGNALQGLPSYYSEYKILKADTWTFPSGVTINFTYQAMTLSSSIFCPTNSELSVYQGNYGYLLTRVQNNLGRRLDFTYSPTPWARTNTEFSCAAVSPEEAYMGIPGYTAFSQNLTHVLERVTDENGRYVQFNNSGLVNPNAFVVTDTMNGQTRYEYNTGTDSPAPAQVLRDGYQLRRWFSPAVPATPYQSIRYDSFGRVERVTDSSGVVSKYFPTGIFGSEAWKQSRLVDGTGLTVIQQFDDRSGNIRTIDGVGQVTTRKFDNASRIVREVMPEGNATETSYDIRGNPVKTCLIGKARAGQSCDDNLDVTTLATYAEGPTVLLCTNPVICNKPLSGTDALDNVTDYTWNATTGDLTKILKPPVWSVADNANVRPSTEAFYTTLNGISFLTRKRELISANSAIETLYDYEAANHYVLKSMTLDDGVTQLKTCLKFDGVGNLISKTDPEGVTSTCP